MGGIYRAKVKSIRIKNFMNLWVYFDGNTQKNYMEDTAIESVTLCNEDGLETEIYPLKQIKNYSGRHIIFTLRGFENKNTPTLRGFNKIINIKLSCPLDINPVGLGFAGLYDDTGEREESLFYMNAEQIDNLNIDSKIFSKVVNNG